MSIAVAYTGKGAVRGIKRTDLTAVGLPDPGVDYVWDKTNNFQITVPNSIAAFLLSQGDFAAVNGVGFGDFFANSPIKVISEGADLALGTVVTTWHDTDPNGSSSARPSDVVIPNVSAGQWVAINIDAFSFSAAAYVHLDMWTIVSGVAVNPIGVPINATVGGISSWVLAISTHSKLSGSIWYQVQAGDIQSGSVRFRMRDYTHQAVARSIAASVGYRLSLTGTGPFG